MEVGICSSLLLQALACSCRVLQVNNVLLSCQVKLKSFLSSPRLPGFLRLFLRKPDKFILKFTAHCKIAEDGVKLIDVKDILAVFACNFECEKLLYQMVLQLVEPLDESLWCKIFNKNDHSAKIDAVETAVEVDVHGFHGPH